MKRLVYTREISMRTFDLGNHCISVEGGLIDYRYRSADKDAEKKELVHHMIIRLMVRGPGMLIERAEAIMPHHPREECPEILCSFTNLEGLKIQPGFTMRVKKAIGGIKGCAHLTSLVIAMGESAVQGYWAAYEIGERGFRDKAIKKFMNTCHVWKEDGPFVKELRKNSQP